MPKVDTRFAYIYKYIRTNFSLLLNTGKVLVATNSRLQTA